MKKYYLPAILIALCSVIAYSCKKEDNPAPNDPPTGGGGGGGGGGTLAMMIIDNGATSMALGNTVAYTATIIDLDGTVTLATGASWSSSSTSIATFSGNVLSPVGQGSVTVTASVSHNGATLTAIAPLVVQLPGIFVVGPSAILVETGWSDITLEPLYIGTETATPYTFSSNNTSVASVSSSGVVTFNGSGSCDITVVASGLDGSPAVVVPVMVLGAPPITPPITRVVVSPDISDIFKGETVTYTAKAYNANGTEMTGAA
ncbi:MAG: hypothetical protein JKY52_18275, partial [Flavobacteriales bacterium]|nr:hypothetical protein [Flavobacteriales bacterium]